MKARIKQALAELRHVKYAARNKVAWPGGYNLFMITKDGACLCADCCCKEFRQIAQDSFRDASTGWRFDGIDSAASLDSAEWIAEQSAENSDGICVETCENCAVVLNP